jgi:hypothetical protein
MTSSSPPVDGPDGQRPRLGIFVDCKTFKAKIAKASRSAPSYPPVPAAGPAAPAPLSWVLPAAAMGLAFVFLLAVSAGVLHGLLQSAPEPAWVQPPRVVAAGPALPLSQPVVQKKDTVAHASAPAPKAKAVVKPAPKKDPAPTTTLAPALPAELVSEIQSAGQPTATSPAVPVETVSQKNAEVAKSEPVSAAQPFEQSVCKEEAKSCATETGKGPGDLFGTAVAFAPSPRIAGEQAFKEQKLLFVLHVSGNFEDPGFT